MRLVTRIFKALLLTACVSGVSSPVLATSALGLQDGVALNGQYLGEVNEDSNAVYTQAGQMLSYFVFREQPDLYGQQVSVYADGNLLGRFTLNLTPVGQGKNPVLGLPTLDLVLGKLKGSQQVINFVTEMTAEAITIRKPLPTQTVQPSLSVQPINAQTALAKANQPTAKPVSTLPAIKASGSTPTADALNTTVSNPFAPNMKASSHVANNPFVLKKQLEDPLLAYGSNPFDAVTLNNKAVVEAGKQNYQAALAMFKRANAIAPARKDIKQNLDSLVNWLKHNNLYERVSRFETRQSNNAYPVDVPSPPALWQAKP